MKLEQLVPAASVKGILPNESVSVVAVEWHGGNALTLTYRRASGQTGQELILRDRESSLEIAEAGRPWSFDGDGALYRLAAEAHRIRLAHLFDPILAVHTSLVTPLPHQITAVYESMLPRQPLRFLLADDPGAGKTIMAGLLIKELIVRGDLARCLIVVPGILAEQWQDELFNRFHLSFEILTNDKLEAARSGNWFVEHDLVIARLDKLSRDEDVQAKLEAPDCRWDLVVFDEAHKLSASFFGSETRYTKRYRLAQMVGGTTRHLLLMSATPHNGKEADFQLFMALLDSDRFEGRYRDNVHQTDASDMMRRMVKESLVKFDGTPLFPERIAYTVGYELSPAEALLYKEVTAYVREQFNRAERLNNEKRSNSVGFALMALQRRLASSPEAIYQSLHRRKERLESRLAEIRLLARAGSAGPPGSALSGGPLLTDEDVDDLEDASEQEQEQVEAEVLDQATAAQTIEELQAEIAILDGLVAKARDVRRSSEDRKWSELRKVLLDAFTAEGIAAGVAEHTPRGAGPIPRPEGSPRQKLVLFTEHRDTLNYLRDKIASMLGEMAIVTIHGAMARDDRADAQEKFRNDPEVQVLLATDAAGEGINLQRAHLMVNYDLPWNPNRLEQRFGRIHRIGQTEVCHLWNLLAKDTREGDVYRLLLEKLEEARTALGGQVFDVLGKLQFEGKPLRDLLLQAIRYGDQPEVRAKLTQAIAGSVNQGQLRLLLDEQVLVHDVMDASRLRTIRDDMDRADARRLQPHYVECFFKEAFRQLGGSLHEKEPRRYEVKHVPAAVRHRDRLIGTREAVQQRYERIAFEKDRVAVPGQALAAFVCPGHPLLDATIDLTLEQHRDLLRRGTVLVDERDAGTAPRVLVVLEHAIRDASEVRPGEPRTISRRMLYVELTSDGHGVTIQYAPYLDYRALGDRDPSAESLLTRPELAWVSSAVESRAIDFAIARLVPEHVKEVRDHRVKWVTQTRAAVMERLTKEINYWDHRAAELQAKEEAGQSKMRLVSQEARRKADDLQARLKRRLEQLDREQQVAPLPPVVVGAVVVIPKGLLAAVGGGAQPSPPPADTMASAARARAIVMDIERSLGFAPIDREMEKLGYDIESHAGPDKPLRFIEVKGRVSGAESITVTRNEILYSLNKPDQFILAMVEFLPGDEHRVHYLREPFRRDPDFGVTSVNYSFAELIARAGPPA